MSKLLPIGTELFFVIESRTDYWLKEAPYHFEITHGRINGVIEGGYKQYRVPTISRLGRGSHLEFPKASDVGKKVWLTYQAATEAAERISEKYDQTWGGMSRECPVWRPWREIPYPQGYVFDFEEGSAMLF